MNINIQFVICSLAGLVNKLVLIIKLYPAEATCSEENKHNKTFSNFRHRNPSLFMARSLLPSEFETERLGYS